MNNKNQSVLLSLKGIRREVFVQKQLYILVLMLDLLDMVLDLASLSDNRAWFTKYSCYPDD